MDNRRRRDVQRLLASTRQQTARLLAPLAPADVEQQHVDFMGPLVWDLGHVAHFEAQWLVHHLEGTTSDPELDRLYDSFESPRPVRGELALPSWAQATAYAADVRDEAMGVLHRLDADHPLARDGFVYRMIAQHENQHQETMLQALDLRRSLAGHPPLEPPATAPTTPSVRDSEAIVIPAGPARMGTHELGDTYDNERPATDVTVDGFALDRFPVTCRRFAAFVADGGYRRPELWSPRGWTWLAETGHELPQGWHPDGDGGFLVRRLGRLAPLDPREPVQHISWFEADAFARWAGGRLPTEVEWEKAAAWDPAAGRARRFPWGDGAPTPRRANVGLSRSAPAPVGSLPAGTSAYGVEQLAGDVYEWTASPFTAYPGFAAFPYREYSEVFFGGDFRVLRGASWANAPSLARATYRNWDHPYRRQVFAGARVAWDMGGAG